MSSEAASGQRAIKKSEIQHLSLKNLKFDSNGNLMSQSDAVKAGAAGGDDEEGKQYWCGIACCKPKFLRKLANVKTYAICQALLMLLNTSVTVGYTSGSLTSIEKHFNLRTRDMGIIVAFSEIGNLSLLLFVGFFGQRGHKPRIISIGAFVFGLGVLISAFPHFVNEPKPIPTALDMDLIFKLQTCPAGNPQLHYLQVLMESAPDDGSKPLTELFGPQFGISPNNSGIMMENLAKFFENDSPVAMMPSKMSVVSSGAGGREEDGGKSTPFPAMVMDARPAPTTLGNHNYVSKTQSFTKKMDSRSIITMPLQPTTVSNVPENVRALLNNPLDRNKVLTYAREIGLNVPPTSIFNPIPKMSADELGNLLKLLQRQPNIPASIEKLVFLPERDSSPGEGAAQRLHRVARETESLEVRKFREYIKNPNVRMIIGQNFGIPTDEESLMRYFQQQPAENQANAIGRLQLFFGDIAVPEITESAPTTSDATNYKQQPPRLSSNSMTPGKTTVPPTHHHVTTTTLSAKRLETTRRITLPSIDNKLLQYLQVPEIRDQLLELLNIKDEKATPEEMVQKFSGFSAKKQERITKKIRAMIASTAGNQKAPQTTNAPVLIILGAGIDPVLKDYLQNPEIKNELAELLGIDNKDATTQEVIESFSRLSPQLQDLIIDDIKTKYSEPDHSMTPTSLPVIDAALIKQYLSFPPVRAKLSALLGMETDATPEELMEKFSSLPPERQYEIVAQMKAAFRPQPTVPDDSDDDSDSDSSPPSVKEYLVMQLLSQPQLMAELKTILTSSPDGGQPDTEIVLAFMVRVLAAASADSAVGAPKMPSMSGNISQTELLSKFGVELPIKCPPDGEGQGSNLRKVAWLAVGQLVVGMGQTPFFPLGISYMDEALDDQTTPIFLGFVMMFNQFGPVLGFFLSSFTLQRYVDFNYYDMSDIEISIFDPRWVGAWWLGYVMLGCIMMCYSFVFLFFPRKLRKHRSAKKRAPQKNHDASEASAMHSKKMPTVKDMPKAAKRIFTNPILVVVMLAVVFEISVVIALSYYAPKFLEQQYGLSKPRASMLFGFLIVPASCIGSLLGGVIVKRFKFTRLSCVRYVLCVSCFVISCYIGLLLSGCDRPKIAGVFVDYDGTPINGGVNDSSVCNADCQCADQYTPVCGSNKVTYYNPCQAGCKELSEETIEGPMGFPLRTFTNCSCVEGNHGPESEGSATLLPCAVECGTLPIFLALTFLAVLFGTTSQNPLIMTIMWTAREEDRAFCLSLVSFLCRILGFIPAPIFVGALIDSTCELWDEGCDGEQGSCLVYDTVLYRLAYLGMALAFKVCAFTCYVITLINIRRINKREKEAAKTNGFHGAPCDYELAPQTDVDKIGGMNGSNGTNKSPPVQKLPATPDGKPYGEDEEKFHSNISENSESVDYVITTI